MIKAEKQFSLTTSVLCILLITLFLIPFKYSNSQVTYEQGYFIDNNSNRIDCLIKNYQWKNSPKKLELKLNSNSNSIKKDINDIKEFQVSNLKYKRVKIEIDQSSNSLSNLSDRKKPEYKEEIIFLKYIIEGCANLFESPNHNKFFYNINGSELTQLVFKEYLSENIVKTNNLYKAQLSKDLNCSEITALDIKNTDYNIKDLKTIFMKFNGCSDCTYKDYDLTEKRDFFNLTLRPGVQLSTLSISNSFNNSQNIDFGMDITFRFGIESEFIFPFNKNKWAFIFEPTYQTYKSKDPRANYKNDVNYTSIEFPLGLRYYMYLSIHSKLFLSSSFVFLDVPINSSIGSLEIKTTNNLRLGLGYKYKNRLSGEVVFSTKREILSSYVFYNSYYKYFAVIVGYSIF